MIRRLFLGLMAFSSALSAAPLSRLQQDMIQSSASGPLRPQELERLKVVRLWGFDSPNIVDDQVMGNRLLNKNIANSVRPLYCPTNSRTYAQFYGRGKITSEETYVLSPLLQELKPSFTEKTTYWSKKVYNKLSELYSNTLPTLNLDTTLQVNPRLTSELVKKYDRQINYSSSLVAVKDVQGDSKVYASDYTVGGWFKPTSFVDGQPLGNMTLFKKYFSDANGDQTIKEWEIFILGGTIFFHNYREGHGPVAMKYLSEDEAQIFRAENSDLFGLFDYREDVLSRQRNSVSPAVTRYMEPPILPSKKTDPKPTPIPMPLPPPPPPRREIPTPVVVGGVVSGTGQVGKEYTARVDMGTYWGADTLGSCYSCADSSKYETGTKTEAWYYMSFSVHLNDPLGPYVDFWVVRDPNPIYFGAQADYGSHVKHRRWELDRRMLSYSNYNPMQYSHEIERKCKDSQGRSCVKSVLEIGGNGTDAPYSGFMRGVYIAKKAFNETESLALAKRFYPDDRDGICTYTKSPSYRGR